MQDTATVSLTGRQRAGVIAAAGIAVLVAVPSVLWALQRLFGSVGALVPWSWIIVISVAAAAYGSWTAWRMVLLGVMTPPAGDSRR